MLYLGNAQRHAEQGEHVVEDSMSDDWDGERRGGDSFMLHEVHIRGRAGRPQENAVMLDAPEQQNHHAKDDITERNRVNIGLLWYHLSSIIPLNSSSQYATLPQNKPR